MKNIKISEEEFEIISEDRGTIVKEIEKHYRHNGSLYEYVFQRDKKYYMISEYIFEETGTSDWFWPVDAFQVEPYEVLTTEYRAV
jgi:hypothetical protein